MTESFTDNKRGKRGSPKVVVVTKKRFSFSSKVNNKQVEANEKAAEPIAKPKLQDSQDLNQSHAVFGGDLRKSGNKVRNLDNDIIKENCNSFAKNNFNGSLIIMFMQYLCNLVEYFYRK